MPQAPGEIGAGTGIGKKRIEDENEIPRQMKLNAKKWERYRRGWGWRGERRQSAGKRAWNEKEGEEGTVVRRSRKPR